MKDFYESVPCKWCQTPTPMTGTKECNRCWELRTRIEWDPQLANKIMKSLEVEIKIKE